MAQDFASNNLPEKNGRLKRYIASILLLVFIGAGAYYGYQQGFFKKEVDKDKPEKVVVEQVSLEISYGLSLAYSYVAKEQRASFLQLTS